MLMPHDAREMAASPRVMVPFSTSIPTQEERAAMRGMNKQNRNTGRRLVFQKNTDREQRDVTSGNVFQQGGTYQETPTSVATTENHVFRPVDNSSTPISITGDGGPPAVGKKWSQFKNDGRHLLPNRERVRFTPIHPA